MPDDKPANDHAPSLAERRMASMAALNVLNQSLAGGIQAALGVPVLASDVLNILCEHLARVTAFIEPAPTRDTIMAEMVQNLPRVMERHLAERLRTPGGIIIPTPGQMPN